MNEEISAVLLHRSTELPLRLKPAPEGRSIKANWLRNHGDALPLRREANPPHLVFARALLPEGTWADAVHLPLAALKPVKVTMASRLIDVRLYLGTKAGAAFDLMVAPVTGDELAHILPCALESVLNLRRRQAMAAV
ncbi:MAG TPA: hypothetical protein VFD30_12210 [Terriglobia bacterium]|jgi:hypothetical protein|nr:hypothetical protein [Terriglobia bacterium]